ncbi:nuclear transport factor 2 family protein [Bernardetia sp.]|uniref:nuclear transport factor 2 family protein n=1 Tax=Bernardetia sp. TaxID=1937974 RepID=UPI0025BB93A5|nr:nuclear transport factor 2 family protein [Bernardetia sp.]
MVLSLSYSTLYAQKGKISEEEKQKARDKAAEVIIKKNLMEFAAAYSKLGETKDVKAVMQHMAKDVTSTLVTFNISDRGSVLNSDYEGFYSYLTKIVRTDGLKINYDVTEILRNDVRGSIGIIVYLVEYEITKNKEIWSKGTETVSMVFRNDKRTGEWKIAHYSVIGTEDERIKGVCSCELYKSSTGINSGNYLVKTIVPSGKNYSTMVSNFEFVYENPDGKGGKRTVRVGDNMYSWTQTGDIFRLADDGTQGDLVAKSHPNDEVLAIMSILKYDIYSENCTNINLKR